MALVIWEAFKGENVTLANGSNLLDMTCPDTILSQTQYEQVSSNAPSVHTCEQSFGRNAVYH